MSRQPSNPEHKHTPNPEVLSLAAVSAKQTLQGRQIDWLVESHKEMWEFMQECERRRVLDASRQRTTTRVWSSVGVTVVLGVLKVIWVHLEGVVGKLLP